MTKRNSDPFENLQQSFQSEAFKDLPTILADVTARSQGLINDFTRRNGSKPDWFEAPEKDATLSTVVGIPEIFAELTRHLLSSPQGLANAQMQFWQNNLNILSYYHQRLSGSNPDPVISAAPGDRRFHDPDWQQDPLFDVLKQQYLLMVRWVEDLVETAHGLSPQEQRKALFFVRRAMDAMAPTNFLLTNPEVLHETIETRGQNLIHGLSMALEDLEKGHGRMTVRTSAEGVFEVGKNLAMTPGKVVYRNDLMELIQYSPSTKKVCKTPLLIIPPWINKYYILDLNPDKSFVKWAAAQGHTVFIISWVNPDERHSGKTFDDYLTQGPLSAMDAIESITGETSVNAIGYCIGGTLLGTLASYLQETGAAKRLKSATFFTTLLDFTHAGDLEVLIDEGTVSRLEDYMKDNGILSGREMGATFSLLRANDMIWQFAVNSYLLGREVKPFDILHWNSDNTNLPAAVHAYYLRHMYLENGLAKPGGITLGGVPLDLSNVTTPCYFLATREDHIAPWQSAFESSQLINGEVKFVLAGSGHVAGVINPEHSKKYGYWTNDQRSGSAPEWIKTASQNSGSWWTDWNAWIKPYSGKKTTAPREPGAKSHPPLCDAPGTYVKG